MAGAPSRLSRASTAVALLLAVLVGVLALLLAWVAFSTSSGASLEADGRAARVVVEELESMPASHLWRVCPDADVDGACDNHPGVRFSHVFYSRPLLAAPAAARGPLQGAGSRSSLESLPALFPSELRALSVSSHGLDGRAWVSVQVGSTFCWGMELGSAHLAMSCGSRSQFEASDGSPAGSGALFDAQLVLPAAPS